MKELWGEAIPQTCPPFAGAELIAGSPLPLGRSPPPTQATAVSSPWALTGVTSSGTFCLVIFAIFPPIWSLQGEVSEYLPSEPVPMPRQDRHTGSTGEVLIGTSFLNSSPSLKPIFLKSPKTVRTVSLAHFSCFLKSAFT